MYLYLIICSIQLFFQHFLSILKYSCSSFIAQTVRKECLEEDQSNATKVAKMNVPTVL